MQRGSRAGHFRVSFRVATSAGSNGTGSSNSGGRPIDGGPSPTLLGKGPPFVWSACDGQRRTRIGSQLDTHADDAHDAASRFEPRDVPPLLPLWLGLLIAAFIVGVFAWVTIGFPLADHQEYRGPLKALPPAPRLETAPVADRQRYDAAKSQELKSIDAAMRATAQQGWGPPK